MDKEIVEPILEEVARLKQVEQELRVRLHQQAAVASFGLRALTNTDLTSLMDETVVLIAETLKVDYCKILELLPNGREFYLKAGFGWKEGLVGHAILSAGLETQSGYALFSNEPVILKDLKQESRFSGPSLLHEHQVVSGMSVIISGKEKPFGVLSVHTKEYRTFTPDDTHFLQGIANVLATALERQKTESALRSSRDQLAIILQGVADGITAQVPSGNLVYANAAAARLLGYPSEKALMETPLTEVWKKFEVYDENNQPFPAERLPGRLALQGKISLPTTIRFRLVETGEERWSIVKATAVYKQFNEVELVVNIFQDITELKRIEQSHRILAETGNLLSTSLDYSLTMDGVVNLVTGNLSDWCAVYILEEDQTFQQFAVAHIDTQKRELAREFHNRFPPLVNVPSGLGKVVRTGQVESYVNIPEEMQISGIPSSQHLKLLKELEIKSALLLPLKAHGRILGALSLGWSKIHPFFSKAELVLADEISRRVAYAIDNARLYREAQSLNAELEQRVSTRTSQLQTLITRLNNEITERRKAEEALRKNERVLYTLFESAPDATILIDAEGKIVRANVQVEMIFGFQKEELIGKSIDSLLPERFRPIQLNHHFSYLHESHARSIGAGLELYGIRKNGTEFPVDIMLSPIQTEEGRLVICAVRDITERKQMQAELNEVQRRIIESIEAERLYLAQELHDGPIQDLYGITYQLSSLENGFTQTSGQDNGSLEVVSSSREMAKHVIDLLRSICGDLRPPSLAPFGLEKAILAHIESISEKYPDLEIKLDLMPDGQLLSERVRLALFRIYQHAINNVIRHAKANTVLIKFAYNEEWVKLRIEDDGCGFEVPSRWVELARGGHMGLVGTAERVESIGGRLGIISAPGKGTVVEVEAPLQHEEEPSYTKKFSF